METIRPTDYRVLLGFTRFFWVLLGFTGFHRVLLGFTRFFLVFLSFTGFYQVLPGFTGFYWVLLGFSWFFWVLPGFTGFPTEIVIRSLCWCIFTELDWTLRRCCQIWDLFLSNFNKSPAFYRIFHSAQRFSGFLIKLSRNEKLQFSLSDQIHSGHCYSELLMIKFNWFWLTTQVGIIKVLPSFSLRATFLLVPLELFQNEKTR